MVVVLHRLACLNQHSQNDSYTRIPLYQGYSGIRLSLSEPIRQHMNPFCDDGFDFIHTLIPMIGTHFER